MKMKTYTRNKLDSEESIDSDINYEYLFLGSCHGVYLYKRGKNDNHICLGWLCEDDEYWFKSNSLGSSFWLDDAMKVLADVKNWIEKKAEPDIYEGNQFGWKFKK